MHILIAESVTMLLFMAKGDFANVMKDFEMAFCGWAQYNHRHLYKGKKEAGERFGVDSEDRRRGPKPRSAGSLWELEKTGKQILFWPPEGHSPTDLFWTSHLQNCKIINLLLVEAPMV